MSHPLLVWLVAAYMALEALYFVALIGKPRTPRTPYEAVWTVLTWTFLIWTLFYVAGASA